MSTALTVRSDVLPAIAEPPRMSGSLAYFVAGTTRIGDHITHVHGSPTHLDRAEAARLLPDMEHLCRPCEAGAINAWCRRLNPAVRNPQAANDLPLRIAAIASACADLPAAVWTSATCDQAMGEFQFWPAAADVRKLLLPHAQVLWAKRDGLRRVIATGAPDAPAARPVPTEAEKEAVAAAARQFVSERSFNREQEERPKVRPSYLSPGVLLATYERLAAEGNKAAEARAEMLRAQISDEVS